MTHYAKTIRLSHREAQDQAQRHIAKFSLSPLSSGLRLSAFLAAERKVDL